MSKFERNIQNIILANLSNIHGIKLDCEDEKVAQFYFVDKNDNNVFENANLPLKKYGFYFYRENLKDKNALRFYIPTVKEHFLALIIPKTETLLLNSNNSTKRINNDFIRVVTTFAIENSINLKKRVTQKLHEQNAKITSPSKKISK